MITFILGSHASLSARSPKIFKFLSNKLSLTLDMEPIDVSSQDEFIRLIDNIPKRSGFKGLLITNPWKGIWNKVLVKKPSLRVKSSGVSNLFWKDSLGQNRFENTDLLALKIILDKLILNNVVIIGTGAMCKTIRLILLSSKRTSSIRIISRKSINERSDDSIVLNSNYLKLKNILSRSSLVINATPSGSLGFSSPPIELNLLKHLPPDALFLDLVHTHETEFFRTTCKKYSINYQDGKKMNNLQAVLGFKAMLKNDISLSSSDLYKMLPALYR